MADNINALAEALRAKSVADARLKGLDSKSKYAEKLRDSEYDHSGSPFASLATAMNKQRGYDLLKDLDPQMQEARLTAAENEHAKTLYDARTSADNTAYNRSRDDINDKWRQGALSRAVEQRRRIRELSAGDASADKYQNRTTGDIATLQVNDRTGQLMLDGKPVNGADWVKYERPLSGSSKSGSGSDDVSDPAFIAKLHEAFQDNYANPAGGMPYAGSISNFLASDMPIAANADMKDRQQWWGNFERYFSMPIRHDMFGSALTNTEKAIWRSASINPDMDSDTIRSNLQIMRDVYEGKYKDAKYNPFIENKPSKIGATERKQNRSKQPSGGVSMPSGVDPAEWAELSEDEQREYISLGLGD